MGEYLSRLGTRIKGSDSGNLLLAEFVSASSVKIGNELFSHGVSTNPDLLLDCRECGKKAVRAGNMVLAAKIGNSIYVICKV